MPFQLFRTSSKPYDGLDENEVKNLVDLAYNGVPIESLTAPGMHPFHREKLRIHRKILVSDINSKDVADYLYSKRILSQEDRNEILSEKTPEDQNRCLLERLPKKGPRAYEEFRNCLLANYSWLGSTLDKTMLTPGDLGYEPDVMQSSPSRPVLADAKCFSCNATCTLQKEAPWPTARVKPYSNHQHGASDKQSDNLNEQPNTLNVNYVGIINFWHGVLKKFQLDAREWEAFESNIPQELCEKNLSWIYRVCTHGKGKVYVVNTKDMEFQCLDVASNRWCGIKQLDTGYRAQYAAMAYCDGRIYISGGRALDGKLIHKTLVSLPAREDMDACVAVQQESEMLYRRDSHQMTGVANKVLVCGGARHTGRLAVNEVYDVATRCWSRLADLPEPSQNLGLIPTPVATFVLGGVTRYRPEDVSPTLSDAMSMYNWQTHQWTALPRLPVPLSNIQGVNGCGSLWVLAAVTGMRKDENDPGTSFTERLECVMEFDVAHRTWIIHKHIPDVGTNGINAYAFVP